jgi:hypothetical protein
VLGLERAEEVSAGGDDLLIRIRQCPALERWFQE